jgi:hypothetical protein
VRGGRRHAVRFTNQQGLALVGILHEPPPERRSDLAVVLLSPGVKNRIAPHGLYVKMADQFVEQGHWVFRFDFYGLGDSEGHIPEPFLADLYGSVGLGRYVEDTWAALDYLRANFPITRFIAGGLCGGAITGVLAAPSRPDVVGILGLGLPVMLEGRNVDRVQATTAGQLKHLRRGYLRKLADPASWLRLLTFKTDLRMLLRSLRGKKAPAAPPAAAAPAVAAGAAAVWDNTNYKFPPAFLHLLERGCPALLLFSEMDRLWWEFEEKFLTHHREALERHKDVLEIGVVPGANHVFTLDPWQADMMARVRAWLDRRFPAGPVAA